MTTAAVHPSEMNSNVVNQMRDTPDQGITVLTMRSVNKDVNGNAIAVMHLVPKKKRYIGCAQIRSWLGKEREKVLSHEEQDPDPVATRRKLKLNQLLTKPKREIKMTVRTTEETLIAIHAALAVSTTLSCALHRLAELVTVRHPEKTLNGKYHQSTDGSMDCGTLIVGASDRADMVLLMTPLGAIKVECVVNMKKQHKNRYNVIVYDNTLIDKVTDILGLEERSRFSIKTIEQLRKVYVELMPDEAAAQYLNALPKECDESPFIEPGFMVSEEHGGSVVTCDAGAAKDHEVTWQGLKRASA